MSPVRDLGVTVDSKLNVNLHISHQATVPHALPSRAFSVWNSLPESVQSCDGFKTFIAHFHSSHDRYQSASESRLNGWCRGTMYRVSPVDAHTVVLQPIHGKITEHYSRYCAVAFCYVHKCELSNIYYILDMMLNCIRTEWNYIE